MNHLPIEKKIVVLSMLIEGNSIRSVERISGVHRDTIMRLAVSAGERAQEIVLMLPKRNLPSMYITH